MWIFIICNLIYNLTHNYFLTTFYPVFPRLSNTTFRLSHVSGIGMIAVGANLGCGVEVLKCWPALLRVRKSPTWNWDEGNCGSGVIEWKTSTRPDVLWQVKLVGLRPMPHQCPDVCLLEQRLPPAELHRLVQEQLNEGRECEESPHHLHSDHYHGRFITFGFSLKLCE